jgi:hypothetical protein
MFHCREFAMSPRLILFAAALSGLFAAPALAAGDPVRDDVMLNLQRCSAITDNRTWLNCFYGAAQPMRAQLGLPPAPESQVSLVKNTPLTPPPMKTESDSGWLGIGSLFGGGPSEEESYAGAMRLSAFTFGKDGLFTATLADGQVWKQSPYDDLRAHWTGQPSSYQVVVSSDMLGSHTMRVRGDQNYRVMRVK